MSAKREQIYGTTSAPTTSTTVYTALGNLHIDQATVCNDTGGAITLTVLLNDIPIYNAYSIASGAQESLSLLVNQGLAAGETIKVTASGADLNMAISGRDF